MFVCKNKECLLQLVTLRIILSQLIVIIIICGYSKNAMKFAIISVIIIIICKHKCLEVIYFYINCKLGAFKQ